MRLTIFTVVTAFLLAASSAFAGSGNGDDNGGGDNGDVRRTGTCTGSSEAKIKLSREDGRIEVEFEVDQNRNGVRWAIVLRQRGVIVFTGSRTTHGPSGSFELRRLLNDRAGADRITARATSPSGELCRASATLRPGASSDDDNGNDDNGGNDSNDDNGGNDNDDHSHDD
jgi:hypothetical protein